MAFRPRGEGFRPRFRGPPDVGFRGQNPRGFGPFPAEGGRSFSGPRRPSPGRGGPSSFGPRGMRPGGPPFRGPRPMKPNRIEEKPPHHEEKDQINQEVVKAPSPGEAILGKDVISLEPKNDNPSERIVLDDYNCDLHFEVEGNGLIGYTLHKDGFEFIWGGGRATHGVKAGRVCFEVDILEELPVNMPSSEKNPHVLRVGWSVDSSNFQLGENDLSYGYGGTAKSSLKGRFSDYGRRFGQGDLIGCYLDLESAPKAIFFTVNGEYQGIAFKLGPEVNDKVLFPHINGKNVKFAVNFGENWPKYPLTSGFKMINSVEKEHLVRAPKAPAKSEAEIIMMVGLPAAGKTVWAENYVKQHPDKRYYVLGTNNIIDKMKVMGLARKRNYHGRWDELIKQATACLNIWLKIAERKVRNYILDQTNVYFTARRRKMRSFQGYRRIAAVLINDPKVLHERTTKREKEEGKLVPESAVMEMKLNFSLPEIGESFEDVMFVEEKPPRAKELVEQFNREGRDFKQYGGAQNNGPPAKFSRNDNSVRPDLRPPFSNPNARAPQSGPLPRGHPPSVGPRFGQDRTNQGANQYGQRGGKPPRFSHPQGSAPMQGKQDSRVPPSGQKDLYENPHGPYRQGTSGFGRDEPSSGQPSYDQSYRDHDKGWGGPPGAAIKQESYDDGYGYPAGQEYTTGPSWTANRSNTGNDWKQDPYVEPEPRDYQGNPLGGYQDNRTGGGYRTGSYSSSSQQYPSSYDYSDSRDLTYDQADQAGNRPATQGYHGANSRGYSGDSGGAYRTGSSYSSFGGAQPVGRGKNNYQDRPASNSYSDPVKQEKGLAGLPANQFESSQRDYYSQGGNAYNQSASQPYDQKPSYASNSAGYYGPQDCYAQSGQTSNQDPFQSGPAASFASQGGGNIASAQWQSGPQSGPAPAAPAPSGHSYAGPPSQQGSYGYSNYGYGSQR